MTLRKKGKRPTQTADATGVACVDIPIGSTVTESSCGQNRKDVGKTVSSDQDASRQTDTLEGTETLSLTDAPIIPGFMKGEDLISDDPGSCGLSSKLLESCGAAISSAETPTIQADRISDSIETCSVGVNIKVEGELLDAGVSRDGEQRVRPGSKKSKIQSNPGKRRVNDGVASRRKLQHHGVTDGTNFKSADQSIPFPSQLLSNYKGRQGLQSVSSSSNGPPQASESTRWPTDELDEKVQPDGGWIPVMQLGVGEAKTFQTQARMRVSQLPAIHDEATDDASPQDRGEVVPDIILLYLTLVRDGALPSGYEREFASLGPALEEGAERQCRRDARIGNEEADDFHRQRNKAAASLKSAEEQFLAAARDKPRSYRTRLQQMLYSGPTPRKDAEEAERARWIEILATLLRGTPTPIGSMLLDNPGTAQLLGAGRRATTLRSRVRLARRYLAWLSVSFEVTFPTRLDHMVDYLKARASEPCTRGTLKNTHRSFTFLEETAGTVKNENVTESAVYKLIYSELLSQAAPGRQTKQAPRLLVSMVSALELLVTNEKELPYIRLYGWWTLLQCWATLRFDDHRGIEYGTIKVTTAGLQAKLTRSKTTGKDKAVLCRPIVVDSSCFVATSTWLEEGWRVMRQIASFERDYLLPAPSKNFRGCRRMELKYDAGFALQNRIVSLLTLEGSARIPPQLTDFWTPHSGRSFMPSCCAALQFPLDQRNYLGGWSAEGSDRYARVAVLRIRSLQGAVIKSIQAGPEGDPLGEQETLSHLQQYGEDKKVQPDEMVSLIRNLETWQPHREPRAAAMPEVNIDDDVGLLQIQDEDDEPADPAEHAQKRRRGGNAQTRTEALGDNPREARARIRQTMQPGFYVCRAGKKHG